MASPVDPSLPWPVLPHDPIRRLAENLWWVEGDLPNMQLRRAMTVARLRNGGLVLHNAVALSEDGMRELESLGPPRVIVVPNGWHRIDAARFKARYPDAKIVCPAGSQKGVSKRVAVDATYDSLPEPSPGDPSVRLSSFGAEDKARKEGAMLVESSDGLTVVLNDALFNLPYFKGFFWWFYGRVLGGAGGPRVTPSAKLAIVHGGTRRALKAFLSDLADRGVVRLIPGHGAPIAENAAAVARDIAGTL